MAKFRLILNKNLFLKLSRKYGIHLKRKTYFPCCQNQAVSYPYFLSY